MSNIQNLQLGTLLLVITLRDAIGHNDSVERTGVDFIDGFTCKYTMCYEGDNKPGALFLEEFSGSLDGSASQPGTTLLPQLILHDETPLLHIS